MMRLTLLTQSQEREGTASRAFEGRKIKKPLTNQTKKLQNLMLQQEGNPLPDPPTHQPQGPAHGVEVLWVALTPNSYLPTMCSLSHPLKSSNSWQFARLNSSWSGWSAVYNDPSAFHFLPTSPLALQIAHTGLSRIRWEQDFL